jgi:hypothetical protein
MKVKHLFQYFCNRWLVRGMVPLKLVTFCYREFPSSVELELMIICTVQGKGTGSGLLYGLVLHVLTEFTFPWAVL